jgi:hypothetical protein
MDATRSASVWILLGSLWRMISTRSLQDSRSAVSRLANLAIVGLAQTPVPLTSNTGRHVALLGDGALVNNKRRCATEMGIGIRNQLPAHTAAIPSRIAHHVLKRYRDNIRKSLKRSSYRRAAWFAAVRAINNPVIAAYLQALLLTGARREELAGLKWDDVDFRWNSLVIHDKAESKGGEDGQRMILLTPYVASMLAMLPRLAHNKALTAAGLPVLTLHGLRRSFGTLSEWCEVPTGVVAQIMGHKPSATAEKHYRVRPLDLLRSWHTKIEAWILEQAGIEFEQAQPGLRVVTAA